MVKKKISQTIIVFKGIFGHLKTAFEWLKEAVGWLYNDDLTNTVNSFIKPFEHLEKVLNFIENLCIPTKLSTGVCTGITTGVTNAVATGAATGNIPAAIGSGVITGVATGISIDYLTDLEDLTDTLDTLKSFIDKMFNL